MQIHSHLSKVQESNLDAWILADKTFCDPIIDQYSVTLRSQPQQGGANQTPMQISVSIAKSATKEKNKVWKQKSLATICILLGTVNADSDELVPATLRQDYINLIEEGVIKAKDAMQNFQQQFSAHTKNRCVTSTLLSKTRRTCPWVYSTYRSWQLSSTDIMVPP
jgi:hypothetical protein